MLFDFSVDPAYTLGLRYCLQWCAVVQMYPGGDPVVFLRRLFMAEIHGGHVHHS